MGLLGVGLMLLERLTEAAGAIGSGPIRRNRLEQPIKPRLIAMHCGLPDVKRPL